MALGALVARIVFVLSVTAAEEDLAGNFIGIPFDASNSVASCASAREANVTSTTTTAVSDLATDSLPAQRRGAAECAAHCLRNPECDGFAFDEYKKMCTSLSDTQRSVSCRANNTLLWKQCGLTSTKLVNATTCASQIIASLPDSAFSATSVNGNKKAKCAKLYNASASCAGFDGAWAPETTTNSSDFMQIDLPADTTITGYDIKARQRGDGNTYSQWVTSFSISYSCDGQTFNSYAYNGTLAEFQGNSDINTTFSGVFPNAIVGIRSIRIQPLTYNAYKALRIELRGC